MEQAAPQPLQPQEQRPGVIKVFGIMHIILGAVGVIGGIISIGSQLASKAILQALADGMGEEAGAEFMQLTIDYTSKLASISYFDLGARLLIAVLIIVAGVALLKGRRTAIKKSNLYCFVSIGLKVLMLVLIVVVVAPATGEFYDALGKVQESAGAAQPEGMANFQKAAGTVGQMITPIVSLVYPILAFIMLNRKPVKDWLAQHGS
jgi:hypothetical protein